MSLTSSPSVTPKPVSNRPPCLMLPASWIGIVPRERPMPMLAIELGALGQDDRHGGQRDDVVDDRRLAEQALVRRQRRLGAHLAALALQAVEQRGLLAADIGAGADALLDIERMREPSTSRRAAVAPRDVERRVERGDRVRIFRADVDVALGRADREAGDRHALDQHERIAFHQHAVGEGAGIALVGVADDVFPRRPARRRRSST